MRRVVGASRWSFIVAAGSDVGCSLLLSSTPSTVIISTTTTTVIALATQRAHRHERRPQRRRHTDWRRTAPLSKSNNNNNNNNSNNDTSVRGPPPRRQRAERGERRQRGEGEVSAENRLNVNITAKGTGRFSHRHWAPKENSSERHFSQGITAVASAAEKHSHNMAAASASASRGELGAFKRLLKVHMAMRSNYESLQQNQQVVVSFSRVCAEALLQLDLPLRRAERVEEKGKDDDDDDDDKQKRNKKKRGEKEMKKKKKREKSTEIVVKISDKSPSNDNDVTMLPLLLPLDSPLYMVPISFPPPPVESLLNISASSKRSLDKDGRDPLLMNIMEIDDITSTEGSAPNSDKCNNINNNNNSNHARDTDSSAAWGTMTPGLEGLFASFQDIPITDIVRLMDTVAYFKWVKDEDLLEWQKGSLLERLRSQVSASHAATLKAREMMSSPNLADDGVKEARQAVELTRKNLLDRLPCVDCVGVLEQSSSSSSSSSAKPCVHVIDAMLNVLMRVCLWRWPSLSCVDQTSVVLLCTFPWFARDMSVEAVSWMTHDYLRRILARDSSINYFQSLVYVQRVRRLCWPTVYDSDSSFVRNIFLIDESSSCTVKDGDRLRSNTKEEEEGVHEKEEKQPQEHQQQCEEAEVIEKNASAARSSLRDVACILCGSPEKQRAAYECLFIWLKQVNASDLHHNSPHGRYVSAIGIAVADVDRFVTERFSTELKEGNFVLLRALQKNTAALEHMTEGLGTPFALSRLFFYRYHKVLPYIWFRISARRRYLLWTAWCCSVARPLVDFVLTPSVGDMKDGGKEKGVDEEQRERRKCTIPFLESLVTSITPDVSFQRLMTRIVILSLNEMSAPGNTQPLEEVCTHLIEVVYTGALVLHCNTINSPEVATNVETKFTLTTNINKMDGKSPEEEEQHQQQQEQQSFAIVAIRRAFNKAISALIQRLNAEHIPLVRRLLGALFEFDTARAKGETPFQHDIRKRVSCICNNEFQTLLGEWLNRRMLLRLTKTTPLSDPLLRRWQQAAEEAVAGLPTALPSLMECYRGLLGLLRRRGHELINVEQQQQKKKNENEKEKKEEEHCVEDSTTHAANTNAPSGSSSSSTPVFSLSELQVILTVLSRLVLARTSTLRSLKVGSLSHEFAALLATSMNGTEGEERSASADNKNDSNFMEKKNDQGSTTDASNTTTSTTMMATSSECVMLLDKLLSSEVISRACELPWNSLLEAILLQLAPYTILETTYRGISGNGETVTAKHSAWAQKLGEEIELHHHQRLVAKHVLLKCFSVAVPCDGGWAGVSQVNRSKSEKELTAFTGNISQVHGITWMLINSIVKTVAKDLRKKRRGLRKVKQKQEEPEDKTKKDATKDIAITEQVESVLDCHALTAYMHLAPLFSTCSLSSCEAYEEFLHSVEVVVVHFAGNHNHHYLWSDCLFLWLAANATVIGVHFSPAQTYTWSPVGGLASLQSSDKEPSGSLEEKTMRLLHILVPYVQSEILRTSNPRLKFLVNTIVAIQAFGRLGINMDPAALNVDQLLLRASTDRRLLYRHLNLFLVGCSALPSTRHALLNTASFLREARNILSPAEMDRALVAISLSADAFAKSHEIQADLQQNGSLHDVGHIIAPTIRVTPTQLRHAWSALGRRILERTGEMPTSVFVKSLQCAGAVACVDTLVCQQLLSFLMEFRSGELSLLDWTVILRTTRQSFENRRGFEEYLREPLMMFLLSLSKEDEADHQHVVLSSGERLVKDLSLFVEALPELFAGDVEFWVLVRRALGVQWVAHFNTTRSSEQQQKLASWLQELTQSYVWAVRTAGHHELSAIPII